MNDSFCFEDVHPLQVKVIIPVNRSERSLRCLRLFAKHFPKISHELYIFHSVYPESIQQENDFRSDLEQMRDDILPLNTARIMIESGKFPDVLLDTIRRFRFDLLILPHPNFKDYLYLRMQSNLWHIILNTQIPILFLPDSFPSDTAPFPVQKAVAVIPADFNAKLVNSFTMKTIRLLGSKTHILIHGGSRRQSQIDFFIDWITNRYFTPTERSNLEFSKKRLHTEAAFQKLVDKENPQLVIFSSNGTTYFDTQSSLATFERMARYSNRPFLFVRRPSMFNKLEKRFKRHYRQLSSFDLTEFHETKNETDFMFSDFQTQSNLFLGTYSRQGIYNALKKYGLVDDLSKLGYSSIDIVIDTSEAFRHRLRIIETKNKKLIPLVDLVIKSQTDLQFENTSSNFPVVSGKYLVIEWLCLQDPLRVYHQQMAPLFGQEYPGLGFGWRVLMILKFMADRLGSIALYTCPNYYHTARFFHRFFYFASPEKEGELHALDRDSFPLHVNDVSWAFHHDLITNLKSSQKQTWISSAQIYPIATELKRYFQSADYLNRVTAALKANRFSIDMGSIENLRKTGKFYRSQQQ